MIATDQTHHGHGKTAVISSQKSPDRTIWITDRIFEKLKISKSVFGRYWPFSLNISATPILKKAIGRKLSEESVACFKVALEPIAIKILAPKAKNDIFDSWVRSEIEVASHNGRHDALDFYFTEAGPMGTFKKKFYQI